MSSRDDRVALGAREGLAAAPAPVRVALAAPRPVQDPAGWERPVQGPAGWERPVQGPAGWGRPVQGPATRGLPGERRRAHDATLVAAARHCAPSIFLSAAVAGSAAAGDADFAMASE
ncbi:uncharacterized protein SOCEGT47_078520 [Sorangium cellulosum]|uniref:Uncharacterized protein n=1 Tax=Sorangium cellulosum TaxID=56 RepID=A0A4P2QD23_SORCE|nr:uncharacterized protein SOCEGT47_078520 [Sorangium cellulosum]